MCEQEGEWSHLCDTILLGDRQLWICMVWSCCLGAQYTASHWEEKGEEKDPCSSCCLVASLPPRKDPQAKVGNRFCHSKCSSYWIQHTQSQEHQLLLHLSLQKLYSTLLTRLSLWEREREREGLSDMSSSCPWGAWWPVAQALKCALSTQMWQSSWALEAVLEGICYSALFSPQRFLMVVLDVSTVKDVCHNFSATLHCSLGHKHSCLLWCSTSGPLPAFSTW